MECDVHENAKMFIYCFLTMCKNYGCSIDIKMQTHDRIGNIIYPTCCVIDMNDCTQIITDYHMNIQNVMFTSQPPIYFDIVLLNQHKEPTHIFEISTNTIEYNHHQEIELLKCVKPNIKVFRIIITKYDDITKLYSMMGTHSGYLVINDEL